jgi:hypothetical protein
MPHLIPAGRIPLHGLIDNERPAERPVLVSWIGRRRNLRRSVRIEEVGHAAAHSE